MKLVSTLPFSKLTAMHYIAVCALFVWSFCTLASDTAALTKADTEVRLSLPTARVLGGMRLSVWGFQVYDAKLWVTPGFKANDYASSSFVLGLQYLREFSGQSIAERSIKEIRNLGSVSDTQAATWVIQMQQVFPDVRSGDVLLGWHSPTGGASFSLNGKPLGSIPDAAFAKMFFGIWLHPKSSAPDMRRVLLGLEKTGP